jgi:hypothetical protein
MRRIVPLVALVAAVAVFAGVRAGGHGSSAAAAVAHAARGTLDAGSARFSIAYSSPDLSPEQASASKAEGVMDFRRRRGHLTYGGYSEAIFDGGVVYFSVAKWLPDAKPWIRTDDQDDPFDPQARALRDPTTLLAFLRAVSSGVTEVGEETIDGVATTRYDGTLDLEKVVEQAPADQREELRDELDLFDHETATTFPYSVWADEQGIARRVRFQEGPERMTTTIDFFDFGAPVVLDLPAASEVMSMDEFVTLVDEYLKEHPDGCDSGSADDSDSSVEGGITVCESSEIVETK